VYHSGILPFTPTPTIRRRPTRPIPPRAARSPARQSLAQNCGTNPRRGRPVVERLSRKVARSSSHPCGSCAAFQAAVASHRIDARLPEQAPHRIDAVIDVGDPRPRGGVTRGSPKCRTGSCVGNLAIVTSIGSNGRRSCRPVLLAAFFQFLHIMLEPEA